MIRTLAGRNKMKTMWADHLWSRARMKHTQQLQYKLVQRCENVTCALSLSLSLSHSPFSRAEMMRLSSASAHIALHPCRKMPFSINASFTLLFEAGFPERFLSSAILQKCSSFTPVNSTTLELSGSTPCLLGILTFGVFSLPFFFLPFLKSRPCFENQQTETWQCVPHFIKWYTAW